MMQTLNKEMEMFNSIEFVPLTNIENVDELKMAIIDGGRFTVDAGNIFENGGFDKVATQLENAPIHCQRIDQKSIGAILNFHQEIKNQVVVNNVIA